MYHQEKVRQGLYDSSFEHDNCGIGAVVNIKGVKSHATVSNALKIVENLEQDRKSTRLNSSHHTKSRMPSSA